MARPRIVPGTRLTRGQVAKRLGVTRQTVANMEGRELHPLIDHNGVRWFAPERVEELAARIDGRNVLTIELDAECYQRAKALCVCAGTTLSAWVRAQIEERLLAD